MKCHTCGYDPVSPIQRAFEEVTTPEFREASGISILNIGGQDSFVVYASDNAPSMNRVFYLVTEGINPKVLPVWFTDNLKEAIYNALSVFKDKAHVVNMAGGNLGLPEKV